jgi:hypothetical protein
LQSGKLDRLSPRELYEAASVRDPSWFLGDPLVLDFRDSVLATWPHLDYAVAPGELDTDDDGQQLELDRYVIFTLTIGDVDLMPELVARAIHSLGLTGFDPQTDSEISLT